MSEVDGFSSPIHFIRFAHSVAATQPTYRLTVRAGKRSIFLEVSTRYAAYVRKEQMPISRLTKCVFLGSGAQRVLLSFRPERSGVFVISTGAEWRNLAGN